MRIMLCYPVERRHVARIAEAAPGSDVVDAGQERIATEILDADIFCGHAKVPMPWDAVVARGRLKWIQSSAAGLDHCLVPSVVASNIVVTSASGLFANQVAEHTVALITALLRSLPVFFGAQQRREFIRRPTRDLYGSTVGIIGFGGNGRRVAEVLAPFRVRIIATDLFPFDKPAHVEQLWHADRLSDLLAVSDIVILCAPLTDRTRGMINAEALGKMKSSAILVNVARGAMVVEEDLAQALSAGRLYAAALDVTGTEPLPSTSKLWELPNVLITPHVGAESARRADETTDLFCSNLRRYRAGQPLLNEVDKKLGFPVRVPPPHFALD